MKRVKVPEAPFPHFPSYSPFPQTHASNTDTKIPLTTQRDERVMVIWSNDIDTIIPTCRDFEERLIKLLWRSRPSASGFGSHPTSMHSHPGSTSGSVSGHSTTNLNTRMSMGTALGGTGNSHSGHDHSAGTATPTGGLMGHSRRNSAYPMAGTPRGVQGMSLVSAFFLISSALPPYRNADAHCKS